jgi:hypothetical protein
MRAGTLTKADFFGTQIYVLADGSKVPSRTFRIKSLKIGDKIIENVNGSTAYLPTRSLAAANPLRSGTVSRSQTMTLGFMQIAAY